MSYTVGVGLLLNDEPFNKVRELELCLAELTGNNRALQQPPHITVKRPFVLANNNELKKVIQTVADLAKITKAIPIRYNGISQFGNSAWYLQAANCEPLAAVHRQLVGLISQTFENSVGELEQDKMVFHTTLALNLTNEEFKVSTQYLKDRDEKDFQSNTTLNQFGVFLSMDNGINWIVCAQISLI